MAVDELNAFSDKTKMNRCKRRIFEKLKLVLVSGYMN